MKKYSKVINRTELPRIPIEGYLDLTFRCNNDCRHCWLRIPPDSPRKKEEITFDEIKTYVDEAKSLGCSKWFISGGEPMLRSDFSEIFDYITRNSSLYTLNTNATLITPKIARLMKRKGHKWVAIYGATPEVNDHITRNPGSFEAAMRGISYLKEAGVGFVIQIIPMKDNYHQYQDMVKLAGSLSPFWRVGVSWLYLSASGDPVKNEEIKEQRLEPKIAAQFMSHPPREDESMASRDDLCKKINPKQDNLLAYCTAFNRSFHINPYGQMTFCSFIKDPSLKYNLRQGSFTEGWENFIPALADKVKADKEYDENCRYCDLREECGWCPVYSYLEKRRYNAKVEYLCEIAKEIRKYKMNWKKHHRRYFSIGDLVIEVNSDLPFKKNSFRSSFDDFYTRETKKDIVLSHHFSLDGIDRSYFGELKFKHPPYAIYKKGNSWIYLTISDESGDDFTQVSVFNHDHTKARIYHKDNAYFLKGGMNALTMMSTDQIFLAWVLAHKNGTLLHSSAVDFKGNGLLFVGHSEAGKSTMVKLFKDKAKILCDDRNIIRKYPEGYRVFGTWSHGEVPLVSNSSAPLKGIFLLNKSQTNSLAPLTKKTEALSKLSACLIKPLLTRDWWERTLDFVQGLIRTVPVFNLSFTKNGEVIDLLTDFISKNKQKNNEIEF